MATLSSVTGFGKRVFTEFREKNVSFMAAGIAYNAFISLAPILILLFLILSIIGGDLEERVVEAAGTWLPGPIADVVTELFQGQSGLGSASVVGVVVLLWGTFKIFRGLDTAFSEIYETESDNSLTDKLRDGAAVFAALVVAVVATVGAGAVFAVYADRLPLSGFVTPLILFAGLVLAFLPIYYVFPDTDVGLRDVVPGVLFAAVGWAAFQGLFQVYLQFQDPGSGSFFGGVIVVVTYLYFSGLVLLVGAVVNAVAGDHSTARPGGVGRGARGFDVRRDESLNRIELVSYLRGLSVDLAGLNVELRPEEPGADRRPRPNGDIHVVEQVADDSDTDEWTVTLTWESTAEPEKRPESTGLATDRTGGGGSASREPVAEGGTSDESASDESRARGPTSSE